VEALHPAALLLLLLVRACHLLPLQEQQPHHWLVRPLQNTHNIPHSILLLLPPPHAGHLLPLQEQQSHH
jgi:hypothetical protein